VEWFRDVDAARARLEDVLSRANTFVRD
jgi:hypothetical protein